MTPSERVLASWREHAREGWAVEKYKHYRPRIYGPVVWESETAFNDWYYNKGGQAWCKDHYVHRPVRWVGGRV